MMQKVDNVCIISCCLHVVESNRVRLLLDVLSICSLMKFVAHSFHIFGESTIIRGSQRDNTGEK